jgi:hypothetical protein
MPAAMLPVSSILLIFYLVILFKWSSVKRPFFYFIGAIGLLATFVSVFFTVGGAQRNPGLWTVRNVLDAIGNLVAFLGAFASCYGAALPVDKVKYEKPAEQQQT